MGIPCWLALLWVSSIMCAQSLALWGTQKDVRTVLPLTTIFQEPSTCFLRDYCLTKSEIFKLMEFIARVYRLNLHSPKIWNPKCSKHLECQSVTTSGNFLTWPHEMGHSEDTGVLQIWCEIIFSLCVYDVHEKEMNLVFSLQFHPQDVSL
jgi:hypothetical protein